MTNDGPFLSFRPGGIPGGFDHAPRGGVCINAFVFLVRDGKLLLGKYAPHPAWPGMTGLDAQRIDRYAKGWTVPGSHLKLGEHPRDAAERVVREMLRLGPVGLGEPRIVAEYDVHPDLPDAGTHYDLSFYYTAELPPRVEVRAPAWFADLRFQDVGALPASTYARQHQDVVAAWLARR